MKILIKEEEEKETIKKNKLLEEEKAQYSVRFLLEMYNLENQLFNQIIIGSKIKKRKKNR